MSKFLSCACPLCGSNQLVARQDRRIVFIDRDDQLVPVLTTHYSMDRPLIEESRTTYSCTCSWAGEEADLDCSAG